MSIAGTLSGMANSFLSRSERSSSILARLATPISSPDAPDAPDVRVTRVARNRWIKRCGHVLPYSVFLDRGVVDVFNRAEDRWVDLKRARRRALVELPTAKPVALWARTPVSIVTVHDRTGAESAAVTRSSRGLVTPISASLDGWVAGLLAHPLTRHFPSHALAVALRSGVYRHYDHHAVIAGKGERLANVFVVVAVVLHVGAHRYAPGDIFGDGQAFLGAPLDHDAVMGQPGVLLEIKQAALRSLVDAYAPGETRESIAIINLDFEASKTLLRDLKAGESVRLRGGTPAERSSCAAELLLRGVDVL